ncbi:B3 domain-containing protein At5g60130-like isoform X2 [Phaseolus vulgaris]|uniref:B3 domain-containing protein At5g60130-like isoform X2 n=1 Tax=Phaseolus vulgaris TaxID=3885 RepID=UPI0035CBD202
MSGAEKYPDFFKVFLQEQHYERMLIPNAFVKLQGLQGRIPEDVLLRNRSERVWHVKTRFFGDKLYFDDGWKIFHEENCLGNADFLVFRYDGVNEFRVTILEISTQCEKTLVKIEEEEEGNEEERAAAQVEETVITQEEQAEDCDIEDEEDSQDQDYDDDNDDSDFDDHDHDDDDDENTEMEEESEEENSVGPVGYASQHYRKPYRRDTASSSYPQTEEDTFKDDEFDPEMCIQPENNFFEAKLYRSRPNELVRTQNSNLVYVAIGLLDIKALLDDIFQESPFKIFPLVFLKRLPLNVANTASVRIFKETNCKTIISTWHNRHPSEKDI